MATEKNPQELTIRGRLSWPNFTYAQALKQNSTSKFPKKDEDVRPNFNLLLMTDQVTKLVDHLRDVFIPWCIAQEKAGEKSGLTETNAKKLLTVLDNEDWDEGISGLIYPVHEKTRPMAPEAVLSVKVNGFKGSDLDLKAIVRDEKQLKNPADDIVIPERGLILPVNDTTLELYPGSFVAAQINMFAFVSGKTPGITASTGAAIFVGDADRFGGGGALDEDELFMSLDD